MVAIGSGHKVDSEVLIPAFRNAVLEEVVLPIERLDHQVGMLQNLMESTYTVTLSAYT